MVNFTAKELKLLREMFGFNPIQIEHYETKWIEGRLTDKKFDELSKLWRKIGYKVFTRKQMDKWLES